MASEIHYWFTLVSPWAFLGHDAFLKLAKANDAAIIYRPVFLPEVFKETGGLPLAQRAPARQRYRMLELQRWREFRGIPMKLKPRHWPFDPKLADCCVTAIVEAGGDPSTFMRAIWEACFIAEEDCGLEARLGEFLSRTGHDAADVLAAAKSEPIRALYAARPQEAIGIGVFGSPCYVLNGEVFWGQDRLELLGRALASKRKPFAVDAA
ncbi:2-hydroxychromene-2-carboxylate isomerase [Rhizobiales bacterium GAS191]|nr:2-hydroxychromene-2-carboxylate isomerase [Rhizobiales bacterium GAS113]SED68935.1 2-hydroxychromene-2-carboxylate isomerase [Rhizobiales bacterium GAS191]